MTWNTGNLLEMLGLVAVWSAGEWRYFPARVRSDVPTLNGLPV